MPRTQPKFRRRDGSGHLDPDYESLLLAASAGSSGGGPEPAFLGRPWGSDPVAEEWAGDFVAGVTSGHAEAQELLDRTLPEEDGGPFVETSAKTELAYD
jgi:hypothetical protein